MQLCTTFRMPGRLVLSVFFLGSAAVSENPRTLVGLVGVGSRYLVDPAGDSSCTQGQIG